jgi:hypothetical protein
LDNINFVEARNSDPPFLIKLLSHRIHSIKYSPWLYRAMAEAFGIVSSGLSVFSLAIQIASSIKTLKNFLDIAKEIPAEVRLAIDELEVLSLVLQDIEQSVGDQSASSPRIRLAVEKAIGLCKASNTALLVVAEEISEMVGKGKRWASVKGALKRDKMARLRGQLESSKTLLILANQCFYQQVFF